MAIALKEVVRCPMCGGADVVYSCEPKCCFNHVCSDCKATFQLITRETGRTDTQAATDATEPPSAEPTAACAVCHSLKLGLLGREEGKLLVLCADCRAVLVLAYDEIAA